MSLKKAPLVPLLLPITMLIGMIAIMPICDANLAFMANNNNQLGVEVETTFGTVDVPIAGHVGFGYQRDDGKFVFGSFGPSPGNLPLWAPGTLVVETFDDWAAVERYLITNYYTTYKSFTVDNPTPQNAWDTMERFKGSYYNLLTSVVDIKNSPLSNLAGANPERPDSENCLTFAKKVLEAYGVKNLPQIVPFITSAPNNYFLSIPEEIHSTISDIEQESALPSQPADSQGDTQPAAIHETLQERLESKPVTLTLYVHDGSAYGPVIYDATVKGQDGSGNSFQQTTNINGYVTLEGDRGTWSFSVSAEGYETNSWDQEITETDTKDAFLQGAEAHQESVASDTESSGGSITGKWQVYLDWNCRGHPKEPMVININADGTLTYDDGDSGNWEQNGNAIRWQHTPEYTRNYESRSGHCWPTCEGTIKMNAMDGTMICKDPLETGHDTTGCWNAVRMGTKIEQQQEVASERSVSYYSGVAIDGQDQRAWPFKLTLIGPDTDGSINGQIEWTTLNAIHLIEGSKTASSITFTEIAYIKKGNAELNCRYYLRPDGGSFKGTWDSCGEGAYGDITMSPL